MFKLFNTENVWGGGNAYGDAKNIYGNVSNIDGDVTELIGCCSRIYGSTSNIKLITNNLDELQEIIRKFDLKIIGFLDSIYSNGICIYFNENVDDDICVENKRYNIECLRRQLEVNFGDSINNQA